VQFAEVTMKPEVADSKMSEGIVLITLLYSRWPLLGRMKLQRVLIEIHTI